MYEIEDIPLSKERGTYPTEISKTCLQLEVGQSFLVPEEDVYGIASRISWLGKRHNKKFGVRRQSDGSFRVGRIK